MQVSTRFCLDAGFTFPFFHQGKHHFLWKSTSGGILTILVGGFPLSQCEISFLWHPDTSRISAISSLYHLNLIIDVLHWSVGCQHLQINVNKSVKT